MSLDITDVTADDAARLTALLELYVYEFSDLKGLDVGEDGRFRTPSIEVYFGDPRAHAFLFRVDGKLAGFAMVQRRSRLSGDEDVCDMAQFFVLRKYRRQGVGQRAAHWLFDRFRSRWEVRQERPNHAATAFWRRAIAAYRPYEELLLDDERWHGPVQRFDSRS